MTAAEYIAAAVGRSYLNRGEVLAQTQQELLSVLTRLFRRYYADASTMESSVFAQVTALAYLSGPARWALPTDIDVVHHLEQSGQPITIVPYEDRAEAEPSEACVYRLGNTLYPVGNSTDPSAIAISCLYTPIPPAFTLTTSTPPAAWNIAFDDMVIVELALFLAKKDARADDVTALTMELDDPATGWKQLWSTWLGRASINTLRRFATPRPVPSPSTVAAGVRAG